MGILELAKALEGFIMTKHEQEIRRSLKWFDDACKDAGEQIVDAPVWKTKDIRHLLDVIDNLRRNKS